MLSLRPADALPGSLPLWLIPEKIAHIDARVACAGPLLELVELLERCGSVGGPRTHDRLSPLQEDGSNGGCEGGGGNELPLAYQESSEPHEKGRECVFDIFDAVADRPVRMDDSSKERRARIWVPHCETVLERVEGGRYTLCRRGLLEVHRISKLQEKLWDDVSQSLSFWVECSSLGAQFVHHSA